MTEPQPPQPVLLGTFTSGPDDQARFARLSGDVNPLHMDAVAARRLLAGRPVVHGMHTVLTALERMAARGLPMPRSLACDFLQPVGVGESATLMLAADERGIPCVTAKVGMRDCAVIELDPAVAAQPWGTGDEADHSGLQAPLAWPSEQWPSARGLVRLSSPSPSECFPEACTVLGEGAVRALASLSYIVGMVCPGLHSVFSSFRLAFSRGAATPGVLRFRVLRFDARTQMFHIAFEGPVTGELRAFLRPEPQRQPDTRELMAFVSAREFADTRCLVIGGSRGLGELTAKLLAAGGSDVTITYASGEVDARRVAADIGAAGTGSCQIRQYIAGVDTPASLSTGAPPDAIFYFATPRIFQRSAAAFDGGLLGEFLAVYVQAFADLCIWADSLAAVRPVRLFYPSSVAVAERPRGMTEYAMSKAAAEVMVSDLGRTLRRIRVVSERLPRLNTDQTATITRTAAASNLDVMLPIVRRVLGA